MIQIRHNVFETNSSSSHAISITPTKMLQHFNIETSDLVVDDDGYVTLCVNGFCSTDSYYTQADKLTYILQVIAAKNHICLNHCGGSKEFKNSLIQLYNTEEFKMIQDSVIAYLGSSCLGIRFDEDYGWGYIDDGYEAVGEFFTYKLYDPIEFIFSDMSLHYHYDG